jgi:hypothetical protein
MPLPDVLKGRFAPLLRRERERRRRDALLPLEIMEAEAEGEYEKLEVLLLSRSGDRYVMAELSSRHAAYMASLRPRLLQLSGRTREFHQAIARARTNLAERYAQASQSRRDLVDGQIATLDQVEGQVRDVSTRVTRKLASVLWRGRVVRVALEGAHAILLLLVFTFGFGLIGERACRWIARGMGSEPFADSTCVFIWAVVTILLFALERWFLGPIIDRHVNAKLEHQAEVTLGFYCVERARLEYDLDFLERLNGTVHRHLTSLGLLKAG